MEPTYTFSRALHMMRYSGAKMKNVNWKSNCYVAVNPFGDLNRYGQGYIELLHLSSMEIMGNWVEVK